MTEKHEVILSMLGAAYSAAWTNLSNAEQAAKLCNLVDTIIAIEDGPKRFLTEQALFQRWYALVSPHPPAADMQPDATFFSAAAGILRKTERSGVTPGADAEQAVKQFMSEGLAAGEVIDVLALADERLNLSVLSDEFLDTLGQLIPQENLRERLLERLVSNQIRVRERQNPLQARLFSDKLFAVLDAYDRRQLTTAQVIERLVGLAKELRDARRRHEDLGLSSEEVAFYDALAGAADEDGAVDPQLAKIAHDLVESIRADLSVDWTSRASTEAAIRRKIKRLLRQHGYKPPARVGGANGHGLDRIADLVLQQARVLYARWPEDVLAAT